MCVTCGLSGVLRKMLRQFLPGLSLPVFCLLGCMRLATGPELAGVERYGPEGEFVGSFIETSQESIFFPCGVRLAEDGWWLRFQPGVQADRVRYQYKGAGFPTSNHDIRIRARLSSTGRFGTGFHTRELVVSSLLDVKNPGGICASYQAKPAKWSGAGPVHGGVRSAVASDDGSLVATLDWLGEITIWRPSAGQMMAQFRSEQTWPREDGTRLPLAFSPDNYLVAAGGSDGFVRVWIVRDGRLLWRLRNSVGADTLGPSPGRISMIRGNTFPVATIAFSPDGNLLVSTGGFRAYTWSMASGKVLDTLARFGDRHSGSPDRAVVAQNPARIITSGPEAVLRVYEIGGGLALFTVASPNSQDVMAVSPDNRWLAMRAPDDSVFLWSLTEGKLSHKLTVPHFMWGGFAFSPDSKSIAVAGGAFAIYIWDTTTGAPLRSVHGLSHIARDLWFTPNGDSIVVSAAFDSSLYVIPLQRRIGSVPMH